MPKYCGIHMAALIFSLYAFGTSPAAGAATVTVDGAATRQTIEGFGGAEGWLFPPNETIRSQIFDELGVSQLRFRMLPPTEQDGNEYNGNEGVDNDNDDPFVIDWGKVRTGYFDVAPLLRAGQSRGVRLIATNHSVPVWMSTGNKTEGNKAILRPGYEDELIEHMLIWIKGLQIYQNVRLDYVCIHNEPEVTWANGSWLYYDAPRFRDMVKRLGARLRAEGLTTKIFGPETTAITGMAPGGYTDQICQDPVARGYLDRLACHTYCSGSSPDDTIPMWQAAAGVAAAHGKKIWETEFSPGASYGEALRFAQYLHMALVYGGVTAWHAYELYRDPSANPAAFELIGMSGPHPSFYTMKQYFRYVRPDAVRVDATSSDTNLLVTAFTHAGQGTFTTVMINRDTTVAKTVTCSLTNLSGNVASLQQFRTSATENCLDVGRVTVSGGNFVATIPAQSIVTFTGAVGSQPGALQFTSDDWRTTEDSGSSPLIIAVTRTGGASGAVSVKYATSDGTGRAGVNYTAATGTLSWADGDVANQTFSVTPLDDGVTSGNKTINLTLSSPTGGAGLGTPSVALLTIEERAGAVKYSTAAFSVSETGGVATVTVSRTGGSAAGPVSVGYQTMDRTAKAGVDYVAVSGTLSWGDRDTTNKTFSVPILDDAVYKGDRTVTLALSNPTGGARLSPLFPGPTLTIVEDDPAPAAGALVLGSSGFYDGRYRVLESSVGFLTPQDPPVTCVVKRVGGSLGAVSVNYATGNGTATAGADYTAATGTLSWANGDTGDKFFTVSPLYDTAYEGDETVNLTLSNPTGGAVLTPQSTNNLIILDNDLPPAAGSLQFSVPSYGVGEGAGTATVKVTRTSGSAGAVSVKYATSNGTATAGVDYAATTGTLSWADGDWTSKTFTVAIADDASYEGDETVYLVLSNPTGGTALSQPRASMLTIAENELRDSDADGMPDAWEIAYFGGTNNTPRGDPASDWDGDGLLNLQEYTAGTNPTNPADAIKVEEFRLTAQPPKSFLVWDTATGRWYSVYSGTGSPSMWTNGIYGVSGDGAQKSFTNADGSPGRWFFRLGVRLQP